MSLPPVKTEPGIDVRMRAVRGLHRRQERLELRVDVRACRGSAGGDGALTTRLGDGSRRRRGRRSTVGPAVGIGASGAATGWPAASWLGFGVGEGTARRAGGATEHAATVIDMAIASDAGSSGPSCAATIGGAVSRRRADQDGGCRDSKGPCGWPAPSRRARSMTSGERRPRRRPAGLLGDRVEDPVADLRWRRDARPRRTSAIAPPSPIRRPSSYR